MICPICENGKTAIVTRFKQGHRVWTKRRCKDPECLAEFTTVVTEVECPWETYEQARLKKNAERRAKREEIFGGEK